MSISDQLELIRSAISGARILCSEYRCDHLADDLDRVTSLEAVEAISLLAGARLGMLEAACNAEIDPAVLRIPQKTITHHGDREDDSASLQPWSHEERAHRAELVLEEIAAACDLGKRGGYEPDVERDDYGLDENERIASAVAQHPTMKDALKILRATIVALTDTEFTIEEEAEIIWRSVRHAV